MKFATFNSPHDVQTKGGGQRLFEQCSKKLHFSYGMASLRKHLLFLSFVNVLKIEKRGRGAIILWRYNWRDWFGLDTGQISGWGIEHLTHAAG